MKKDDSIYIFILLISFTWLFIAGCGSENSETDYSHTGDHMENHADEHMGDHSHHDGMTQVESSMEEGGHHGSDEMMKKPDDARLVTVSATDHEFTPAELSAKPGEKLYIKLVNQGSAVHMWQLRNKPETHIHTPVGETSAKVVIAPEQPGDYDIICLTPGHEKRGMVGTLKVSH